MSDGRLRRMSDEELSTALRDITLAWPATPPLEARVAQRIGDLDRPSREQRPRLSLPSRRRTVLIVVAVVLALASAAVATKLVIDIGAETIQTASGTPGPLPVASARAFGDPVGDTAEAESDAGYAVGVPGSLGSPDHVWVGEALSNFGGPPSVRVTLAWDPRPSLPAPDELPWGGVLMEFNGDAEQILKKVFPQTSSVQRVAFEGRDAYWIVGEHTVTIADPQGTGTADLRVTGNVLIWQAEGRTFRLETSLGLGQARSIASSVR
jgi:hypothetical protein